MRYLIPVLMLSALVTVMLRDVYKDNAFSWGLKSAQAQAGECLQISTDGEFDRQVYKYLVQKVGKKEYLMALLDDRSGQPLTARGHDIPLVDRSFVKIQCPAAALVSN